MNYDTYRGVFNADIISCCVSGGELELPLLNRVNALPNRLISFDKAINEKDTDQWVHFFIHDYQFERIWRNPWRYLPVLSRFNGVIAPDFSVFWELPLYIQVQSIGKSRQICSWLRECGITVIPCIRWAKEETYKYAFSGVESGGTIAVGTAGCMREKEPRQVFEDGFKEMIITVKPRRIIVYGPTLSSVFAEAKKAGIEVVSFASSTTLAFEKRGA